MPAASLPRTSAPVTSRAVDADRAGQRRGAGPAIVSTSSRLAVVVDARDADDLPRVHLQDEPAHRGQAAIVLDLEAFDLEQRLARLGAAPWRRGRARRGRPSCARGSPPSRPRSSTVSTFLPRRSTLTRSAISSTSPSLCEMKTIDLPSAVSVRRILNSSAVSWAVSTAVGSSRISISAPRSSARRISTRCCWPTEMSPTRASGSTREAEAVRQLAHAPAPPPWCRAARPCAARRRGRCSRPPSSPARA